MEQLHSLLNKKQLVAVKYQEAFKDFEKAKLFQALEGSISNYWLNALILNSADMNLRDDIITATNKVGLMTRPTWTLLHKLPMYSSCPRTDLGTAEDLEARIINIPSSPSIADNFQETHLHE